MPDTVLGIYLVALCALAAAWILDYRWISRRLRDRHARKHAAIFGTPERRKNELDRFLSLLGFLFQDQAELRDMRLLLMCVLMKALAVVFVVVFIVMMFTPFFLHLNDSM